MKRIVSLISATILIFSILSVSAYAWYVDEVVDIWTTNTSQGTQVNSWSQQQAWGISSSNVRTIYTKTRLYEKVYYVWQLRKTNSWSGSGRINTPLVYARYMPISHRAWRVKGNGYTTNTRGTTYSDYAQKDL